MKKLSIIDILAIVVILILLFVLTGCGKDKTIYKSCTVDANYLRCPDGSVTELPRDGYDGRDGIDGVDGIDGENGAVQAIYDPCGDLPGYPDEIVLIMSDMTILAWYKNLGLTVLEPGVGYQTTDKQKCRFRVINGEVEEY